MTEEIILRDYQTEIANKAVDKLKSLSIVYLALEVRVGKTFTALEAAYLYGAKKVLFLTVKKAIGDISGDIDKFGKLDVEILSIDSAHKATGDYDLIIVDEAHGLGAFPKPSNRAKNVKKVVGSLPVILMSGTPHPESMSQLFHQFWISDHSPFSSYTNFYKFAHEYVDIKQRVFNGRPANDYSRGKEVMFTPVVDTYFLNFSQKQANFHCEVEEHIIDVKMQEDTMKMIRKIKRDKVLTMDSGVILAETPVKMMSKCHQLSSGTVILEETGMIIVDNTKAKYIEWYFKGKKIAIFYKYKAELEMLKAIYGDNMTEDIVEFNETGKNIALQIRSGSMGVNLSAADCQVFLNIDFSSKDYIQSRARLQTQKREKVDVYFLFSEGGIERDIYKSLQKKEDYTARYYKQYF